MTTATDKELGQHKRQFATVFVGVIIGKHTLAYFSFSNGFPIGGDGEKTYHTAAQYAFYYFFKNGWEIGTDPEITVDWTAKVGRLPVKWSYKGSTIRFIRKS